MSDAPRARRSFRQRGGDALVLAALAAATVVFLFPIYTVVATSFKLPIDVVAETFSLLFTPTLDNYLALVGLRPSEFHFDLGLHFRNSLLAASGSTILALLLGTPAAYAFARVRFRGGRPGMLFLLALRLLPPIATVIPLFLIMRSIGLLDTVLALILAYTTFNLPFIVWMMYSFFLDLPRELEEAALIDGATRLQAFVKVILPLSLPGLAAAAIFSMVLSWNDFIFAVTLTARDAPTLPLMVSGFVTDLGVSWGIMMAAGSVIVVPVLIFTFFTQRYLLRGVTAGAMKD
jgi:multiple sugar transport system permease protein